MNAQDHIRNWELMCAVEEAGTLSAAADRMGIALPQASRMMGALERDLGITLLDRARKPASLTPAALSFLPMAHTLVDIHRMLLQNARAHAAPGAGTRVVRIGFTPNTDATALYRVLLDYENEHPGIRIQALMGDRHEMLLSREADIMRLGYIPANSELFATALDPGVTMLLAHRSYIQRRGMPRSPADLAHHTVILRNSFNRTFSTRLEKGGDAYYIPQGDWRQGDSLYCLELLKSGAGIAVDVSLSRVQDELAAGELVPVLPGWHREPWHNSVACRREDSADPVIRELMILVARHFNSLGAPLWQHWFRRFGIPLETVRL